MLRSRTDVTSTEKYKRHLSSLTCIILAIAATVIGGSMLRADATAAAADVPYTPIVYPGADFASITCPRGPSRPDDKEIDRRALAFMRDVASGSTTPHYLVPLFPKFALPSASRSFAQLGRIQTVRFYEAHVACAYMVAPTGQRTISVQEQVPIQGRRIPRPPRISVSYYYQVVGTDATMWEQLIFRDKLVEEFHQGPRPADR
jgi:hypothetical protein